MIKHELARVWITSDGKKFLNKKEAEKHEQKYKVVYDLIQDPWNY